MPEGLLTAGGGVAGAVYDDPDHPPEPTAEAPRGWVWKRKERAWEPRQRGPVKWAGDANGQASGYGSGPADPDPSVRTSADSKRDPDPSWIRDDNKQDSKPGGGKRKQSIDDVPREVVDDIAGFAGLVGAPLLAMLQQADPYCGTALAQSFEGIVDATLPLICRSKKITDYFTGDKSDWLLWGKLALALRPFAQAVIEHHVIRSVQVIRDEHGQAHVMRAARGEPVDNLTPPFQPEYNYAA